jgi:hypothetical protein
MKKIQLGDEEFDLCENVNDIFDIRFPKFLQYFRMAYENVDKPLFEATRQKALGFYNKQMPMNAFMEYENYWAAVKLPQVNLTGMSMCFAIICLENGEDQAVIDEAKLENKLERMRKAGLTRGMVEDAVTNFIVASPNSFGELAKLMELMKVMSQATS